MQTKDFHFHLPEEQIARHPVHPRDHSKLMVIDRKDGSISHRRFYQLNEYLTATDLLVLNNSRVIHARVLLEPGNIELLLLKETSPLHWLAIGRPSRKLQPGDRHRIQPLRDSPPVELEILRTLPDGSRVVRFFTQPDLKNAGQLPLPPYILKSRKLHAEAEYTPQDEMSYQTVYADQPGSVAAPTAGLHFTPELLRHFNHTFLTLDIGLGTFRPVKSKNVEEHEMHREHYDIPAGLAEQCAAAQRVVAVGTTVCRVLESRPSLTPGPDTTSIFITPPYTFQRTDVLLTNFHLPESTLVMLVAAFGGYDLIMHAYQEAVKKNYRFYSYGDSMLIL
ncbi:MAG: tRNA preQ1(34) S-adenosylmethionine ribosyltransferase-isomerase QueA [Verrucomicrobiota bacterium]